MLTYCGFSGRKKKGVKMSASLLQHEQGHYDLAQNVAKMLQAELRSILEKGSGSSKEEARKNCRNNLYLAKERKKATAWAVLDLVEDTYEFEVAHGTKATEQGYWNGALGKGEILSAKGDSAEFKKLMNQMEGHEKDEKPFRPPGFTNIPEKP